MRRSDPGLACFRLRCHLQRTTVREATGLALLQTTAELAETLGISRQECQQAISSLTRDGELQARLHPGGRYELRLSSSRAHRRYSVR
jgi:hypothetical protein